MDRHFAGKRVWVTGAGRGIGRAVAEGFAAEGATVTGFDLDFGEIAPDFEAEICDVASAEAVTACSDRLAGNGVDIFVHAAGVLRLGGIGELSAEDWATSMAVNAGGAFHFLRLLAPLFRLQQSGTVVAVASNAGHVPRVGMAAYGASKAALSSLVRSVGLELAPHGVRCNLVSPGSTDTAMLRGMGQDAARFVSGDPVAFKLGIPLGKIATVEDIAAAVLFLASPQAGHITLQDLVIDGGATLGA